jgi:HSP20 family protein
MYKFLENHKTNSLWRDFDRLNEAITRSFLDHQTLGTSNYPAINVYTKEEEGYVQALLPGMELEDIEISIKDNAVNLKGRKKEEELAEGTEVHLREIFSGEFHRTLEFPFRIDADKVKAEYKNGILGIFLPRAEEDKPKKIRIQAN